MTLSFQTMRLEVNEIDNSASTAQIQQLIAKIPYILTADVVTHLPAYFHHIDSASKAEQWLTRMCSESRLLQITLKDKETIGFLFTNTENEINTHIGYVIAQQHWGKGYASELLQGFIHTANTIGSWHKLIAGVDKSNFASVHLLKKQGFSEQGCANGNMYFFEYALSKAD
ncbi:N-acetyltransferase [Pseudoalteromonas sp. J010]|uniref:GNAT family N-acetyltransferase n=1 Tax=Pseudoalteromonas sp. J010 TaxID=998465 RepID=UPI000F64FBD2|nr:GNAT family N-acetyltransferase [Pseudoalteromonas sp. J010]RRS07898.1 N-acetyltransferase [Pseudoalteromonas sp. J010]